MPQSLQVRSSKSLEFTIICYWRSSRQPVRAIKPSSITGFHSSLSISLHWRTNKLTLIFTTLMLCWKRTPRLGLWDDTLMTMPILRSQSYLCYFGQTRHILPPLALHLSGQCICTLATSRSMLVDDQAPMLHTTLHTFHQ